VARQFGQVFHAQMLWLESLEDLAPLGENAHAEA
jgi:hypothetical protein